jgi:hypothetical protein
MTYLSGKTQYNFVYSDLRELFNKYSAFTDEEFMVNLIEILHFSCFVCYLKGYETETTLSDEGIIHQLVHLLHIPDEPVIDLQEIREQFNNLIKIC